MEVKWTYIGVKVEVKWRQRGRKVAGVSQVKSTELDTYYVQFTGNMRASHLLINHGIHINDLKFAASIIQSSMFALSMVLQRALSNVVVVVVVGAVVLQHILSAKLLLQVGRSTYIPWKELWGDWVKCGQQSSAGADPFCFAIFFQVHHSPI